MCTDDPKSPEAEVMLLLLALGNTGGEQGRRPAILGAAK